MNAFIENGYDIITVQEHARDSDVITTMIYMLEMGKDFVAAWMD